MAIGTQFTQLVQMLREELGRSSDLSVSQDDLPQLKRVLIRNYETLFDEHDWPQLRQVFPRISLAATQRFYDMPTGLNPERVESVNVWYSGLPHPVERGISTAEYAAFDSVAGETSEPVQSWDFRWSGDGASGSTQIEVWPIPSGNDMELEFIGTRAVNRLVADADLCLLDDQMVVLFSAAQLLARQKSEDAGIVAEQAASRFNQMKKRISNAGARVHRMGLGTTDKPDRYRAIVRVR